MKLMYDFQEQLNFSEGIINDSVLKYLLSVIPSATHYTRAKTIDDRNGTDYWIHRPNLPPTSIDMKNRSFCPIKRFKSDDIDIETTSVYTGNRNIKPYKKEFRKAIGWTLNIHKRTDFIVYTWPNDNGRRFWILPFLFLCQAALQNQEKWIQEYDEKPTLNNGYCTLNIYVPRKVVATAMKNIISGTINDNLPVLASSGR